MLYFSVDVLRSLGLQLQRRVCYMAGKFIKQICILFVDFIISDDANARKCYACNNPGEGNCNDEFKSTGITVEATVPFA